MCFFKVVFAPLLGKEGCQFLGYCVGSHLHAVMLGMRFPCMASNASRGAGDGYVPGSALFH